MTKVNKDARNFNKQFNKINDNINKRFEENANKIKKEFSQDNSNDMTIQDDIKSDVLLPHQRSIEDNIIIIRETFFHILELLANKKNPIPYISSSPDRFFAVSLTMIILGTVFLLLSNLMKSKDE